MTVGTWPIRRLKTLASVRVSNVDKKSVDGEEAVCLCNYTDVYYRDRIVNDIEFMVATAPAHQARTFALQPGDVLITKDSESWDDIAVAAVVSEPVDAICGYHLALLRPQPGRLDGRFLFYSMESMGAATHFKIRANGVTRYAIGTAAIGDAPVPTPPLPHQVRIADYLDTETTRIDTLIDRKQRFINLLLEKRTALISQAVDEGLGRAAGTKNSDTGGEEHVGSKLKLTALKHLLSAIVDTEHKTVPFYPDGEYLVCRTTNVRDGSLCLDGAKYTDEAGYREWTSRATPRPGDIVFTREAPAGEACIVPETPRLCLGQRTVLFKVNPCRLDPRFAVYSLYGGPARQFITLLSQGSTVAHFNMGDIGSIPMTVPSVEMQRRIADYLDSETGRIDSTAAKTRRSIDLLREYRTALISAAVTGQIDIPGTETAEEVA
ncbi:MAG: restriction endonuclease subunit S [Thermoleophilia bacterium]